MNVKNKFDLRNKIAIITGGAGLIGGQHVEVIAEYGGIPVILDIDEERSKKKAAEIIKKYSIDCISFKCDVTNKDNIENIREKLIHKYGKIDILINNAAIDPKITNEPGTSPLSRFEKYSEISWDEELAVGLKGAFLCSQVFVTDMVNRGKGVILNISSDLGIIAPDQRIYGEVSLTDDMQPVKPVTYSVIKHGLIGMTKYLATYWADKGIRVNALCPGGVYDEQPDNFVKKLTNLIPLGRMAQRDEYKAAVLFLVSDASSYMTGASLVIDGGRTTW